MIKALLAELPQQEQMVILDCPPGSGCMVMESISEADYCVLVAEPTIFGAHNLQMVYELVKLYHQSFGVILNKCVSGDNPSETFCKTHGVKILGEFPLTSVWVSSIPPAGSSSKKMTATRQWLSSWQQASSRGAGK